MNEQVEQKYIGRGSGFRRSKRQVHPTAFAEYDSAAQLLARIQAEREKSASTKPKR